MRILEVTWHDAHSDKASWIDRDLSEIDDGPLVVKSVGFEMKPGKRDHVVLTQSYTDDHVDHVLLIPKAMVQRIIVLRK